MDMEISIGDKVRFLNDVGGGIVSGFQKGGIVLVQDEDGFEVPVLSSEVVVIDNAKEEKTAPKPEQARPVMERRNRKEKPEEPTEEDLRIAELKEYYNRKEHKPSSAATPVPVLPKDMEHETEDDETLESRVIRLEMTVRRLQMRLERLEDAKAAREKNKTVEIRKRSEPAQRNEPVEIDLHAGVLLETTAGMGAREIKDYQLQVVRDTINGYIKDKGRKIVFIHGNGEGVLRKALTDMVRRDFPSCTYQDASFRQYGFGATMVIIH